MRNLGVHAGLALVGIIAGLPVAAVVQWHRVPPAEVWSRVGRTAPAYVAEHVLYSASHQFALGPGATRVTSLVPGAGFGSGGTAHLTDLVLAPAVLATCGQHVFRVYPTRRWIIDEEPVTECVDGVRWHRIRLGERP